MNISTEKCGAIWIAIDLDTWGGDASQQGKGLSKAEAIQDLQKKLEQSEQS